MKRKKNPTNSKTLIYVHVERTWKPHEVRTSLKFITFHFIQIKHENKREGREKKTCLERILALLINLKVYGLTEKGETKIIVEKTNKSSPPVGLARAERT